MPAVAALQTWIEEAWARGWDPAGAEQLNSRLSGGTTWIGTTEVAALLRASRLRARIVDFEGGGWVCCPPARPPMERVSSPPAATHQEANCLQLIVRADRA